MFVNSVSKFFRLTPEPYIIKQEDILILKYFLEKIRLYGKMEKNIHGDQTV